MVAEPFVQVYYFFCGHMPSLVPPSLINEEDVRLCKAGRMQVIL